MENASDTQHEDRVEGWPALPYEGWRDTCQTLHLWTQIVGKVRSAPFYGANRPGSKVSQGVLDMFWLWSMQVGLKGAYDCIKAFSETDLTEDLKQIDVPTLIIHGDDDQIVPIGNSALLSSKIVKDATLKIYPGAPHGLMNTHKEQFNADLLSFLGQTYPYLRVILLEARARSTGLYDTLAKNREQSGLQVCAMNRHHGNSKSFRQCFYWRFSQELSLPRENAAACQWLPHRFEHVGKPSHSESASQYPMLHGLSGDLKHIIENKEREGASCMELPGKRLVLTSVTIEEAPVLLPAFNGDEQFNQWSGHASGLTLAQVQNTPAMAFWEKRGYVRGGRYLDNEGDDVYAYLLPRPASTA